MERTPAERLAKRYAEQWTPRKTAKLIGSIGLIGAYVLFNIWLVGTPSGLAFWAWVVN